MNKGQISTKNILFDLMRLPGRLKIVLEKGNEFNVFLSPFLECDWEKEFGDKIPSVKQLSIRFNIKYDRLRNYLYEIYDAVIDEAWDVPFEFSEIEYWLEIYSQKRQIAVNLFCKSIPVLPRVGESIDIPFLYAYFENSRYYVQKISHEFTEKKQVVHIELHEGEFNPYWHFRKAQAEEEGELSFEELMNKSDFELKYKLKIGR
ncbi:hypothetical protein KZP23_01665 [Echinicola marina]|uniref:hypothetical protein n=1 Tax=Echinicola marina TaxID=2859768 RepID=UPI001CF711D9|nr:hypothetical protein [Echinicola marina]UCS93770.1 hypothetical protein KZP23_01665 [Echinicola marina]